uniref:Uncharacterized protein n=1 Tax=Candidatus Kentrum sp. TUN TaxID=2126343 RepID=A0A450ZCH5_9GAMM|nr:MAG: hypothetical protein BECKTUN1418D_GA0071000_100824 [Candidatus Kentron sp. TUN]
MKALAKLELRVWGKDADAKSLPKENPEESRATVVILPDNGR